MSRHERSDYFLSAWFKVMALSAPMIRFCMDSDRLHPHNLSRDRANRLGISRAWMASIKQRTGDWYQCGY